MINQQGLFGPLAPQVLHGLLERHYLSNATRLTLLGNSSRSNSSNNNSSRNRIVVVIVVIEVIVVIVVIIIVVMIMIIETDRTLSGTACLTLLV